jgi:predicted ABC-type transport system involved in lysophospholipase L1 biosynthesis ATPase subunit
VPQRDGIDDGGALLELRDVVRRFDAASGGHSLEVLHGITLTIERGQSVAIIGPSGSGKSTLLNLMGGLDRPTAGEILFAARSMGSMNDDELARLRNREIGFVFQDHHLLPQCTALENTLIPTLVGRRRKERAMAADRARHLLGKVGLGPRMSHRPGQLSGGECQRVAVVRALINGPRLLLADEPTGSLDGRSAGELADLLAALNEEEAVTLVSVTHSTSLASRMTRILQLEDGRLAEAGGATS